MVSCSFGYGPPLLPDELFYSWLGRFSLLNALGSSKECIDQILGSRTIIPIIDLPTNLLSVQSRLDDWLPFQTLDQLIDLGTLLPYHRPFLDDLRHEAVREILVHGGGQGMKSLMGRIANRFGANPSLRYCARCVAESVARYGCPYWLRQHQLPGVTCCARHGVQLHSRATLQLRTDRHQFLIAPCRSLDFPQVCASDSQLRFASLSQKLLLSSLPPLDPQLRATVYRHAVHDIGLGNHLGRIDYEGLAEAVRTWFSDFRGFVHRERLLAPTSKPLAWVKDLIERPHRAIHPICHLLLIDFLFGSIDSFSKKYFDLQPNPEALIGTTRMAAPVREAIHDDHDHELLLYDVSFSCRQVASIIGKSVTTVVTLRRVRNIAIHERRKTVTPDYIASVLGELRRGRSPKEVAVLCDVSLSTVYRVRSSSIPPPPSFDSVASLYALTEHRRCWQSALAANFLGGVNAVRAAAPAVYGWLYRHDREWLMLSTQAIHRQRTSVPRTDWKRRDSDCCTQVRKQVTALRKLVPPRRVTKTQLLRPLGETMFRKNSQKLPLLAALLDQICDSTVSFGIRRVDYAIATLARSPSCIKLWHVKRIAGLRLWPDTVYDYAVQEVERMNSRDTERIRRVT